MIKFLQSPPGDVVIQLLSHVRFFAAPWSTARQAPLSSTISWSLCRLRCIESVMPSNHLTLCHFLLLPSTFPSIRIFSNELALRFRWPKYWSFSNSPSSKGWGACKRNIEDRALDMKSTSMLRAHDTFWVELRVFPFFPSTSCSNCTKVLQKLRIQDGRQV